MTIYSFNSCNGQIYRLVNYQILNIIMFIMIAGCELGGRFYLEGEMVQGVAQSQCENCFCMKGRIQCMTIECTPPLLGCSPVLTSGKCCPTSYNCSKYN